MSKYKTEFKLKIVEKETTKYCQSNFRKKPIMKSIQFYKERKTP